LNVAATCCPHEYRLAIVVCGMPIAIAETNLRCGNGWPSCVPSTCDDRPRAARLGAAFIRAADAQDFAGFELACDAFFTVFDLAIAVFGALLVVALAAFGALFTVFSALFAAAFEAFDGFD